MSNSFNSILKLITTIIWWFISLVFCAFAFCGTYLLAVLAPTYFWILFGLVVVAIIIDFITFRNEKMK